MNRQPAEGEEIHRIWPDQDNYHHAVSHEWQELLSDGSLWSRNAISIQSKSANRG